MSKGILDLTAENFEKEAIKSGIPVLVDFWAQWCGPCKALAPVLEEIASENSGKLKVAKVNVDDNSELATKWDVMNIPTMIIFKNGKEADRLVGFLPKAKIAVRITKVIG